MGIRETARSKLEALMQGIDQGSLDTIISAFETHKSSLRIREVIDEEAVWKSMLSAYQDLYSSNMEVRADMLKQVTSNGIEANAVELYMQECSSNSIDYEKFKGMFPEKTRFYRFLEVMDHFVIMSLRTYLGFELEPLTPEGERMKVALSVYNKAEANEYAQLTLDAETPQDYIRKGIERKLISGADFFQSLGADLGRLYSSNPNLRSYIKLQILPKWNRPKTNVFLESPSTICAMTMEHYGLAIEEVDEFRNDMGQLILDVMKRYVKGEIC